MLCLNCGKDVGDKIGLCEACSNQDAENEASQPKDDSLSMADEVAAQTSQSDTSEEDVIPEEIPQAVAESTAKETPPAKKSESEKKQKIKKEKKSASVAKVTKKGSATRLKAGVSPKLLILPVVLLLGILVGYFLIQAVSSPEYSAPSEVESPSVGDTDDPAALSAVDTPFPTAPHIVDASILTGEVRTPIQDAVFIYYPFQGKIEIGLYRESLTSEQKERTISEQSLVSAPADIRPYVLFSLFTEPGAALCDTSSISGYTVRFAGETANEKSDVFVDLGDNLGGISEFSCLLSPGSPFAVKFGQTTSVTRNEESTVYQWDANISGPVYVSRAVPLLRFTGENSWSMGVWNKEERNLTIGFFRQRLTAEQRAKIRETRDIRAIVEQQPNFMMTFEILAGYSDFRQESLRSYGLHFVRSSRNDGKGFYFPGESDIVSFYEIVGSEATDALSHVNGQLFEAESVSATVSGQAQKEIAGQNAKFVWEFRSVSPIIDVLSDAISSVVFDPELAEIDRSVPDRSEGIAEASKAQAMLVDAIALFYPAEANLVVGMFSQRLTEADRANIIANKGVWQSRSNTGLNLVVSIDLKEGSTSLMRNAINTVRLTFVRDRLGDFYFPGRLDRATVTRAAAELDDTTLSHISGNADQGGNIAFRLKGSYLSEKSGLSFNWRLAVREKVTVIE